MQSPDEINVTENDRVYWLSKAPKYTKFRINKLKNFNIKILENFLQVQAKELETSDIPRYYLFRPDCLVVEQWPEEIQFEKNGIEVIVDPLCAAAVLRGAHVFAPGVLGLSNNCKVGDRVDIYGDLDGRCKRGMKTRYTGRNIYVGTGILKMSRRDLFENGVQPSGIAVQTLMAASRLPIINETICPQGEIVLQNLPSIICVWVVNPKANETILDMCAAPGNKTTHLGEMSLNKAKIIAIDKTTKKVETLRNNCKINGITCVEAYSYDSTKCYTETSQELKEGPPFAENSFDKILLDGPCSGLGQRPQLVNRMTPKILQSYKFVQRKLLEAASKVLKVGGELTYSTCTTTIDENEGMVAWVLERLPCLKLIPAKPLLGGPGLPNCGLNDEQRVMVQRFGPENDPLRHVDPIFRDTIGFFIAKFVKIG